VYRCILRCFSSVACFFDPFLVFLPPPFRSLICLGFTPCRLPPPLLGHLAAARYLVPSLPFSPLIRLFRIPLHPPGANTFSFSFPSAMSHSLWQVALCRPLFDHRVHLSRFTTLAPQQRDCFLSPSPTRGFLPNTFDGPLSKGIFPFTPNFHHSEMYCGPRIHPFHCPALFTPPPPPSSVIAYLFF